MTELKGYIKNFEEVNLQHLFPDQTNVFAYWFNGRILIPQGELLKYKHLGYQSIYEKTLILEFENGILITTSVQTNSLEKDKNEFDDDTDLF